TFVAPANVIKYIGADPLLVDVNLKTWQMDLDLLENFLKSSTGIQDQSCYHIESGRRISAIVPVHVLGNMCDMDRLIHLSEFYHDEVGYNYRLVNILAAMGVAQLEQLNGFLKRKVEIKNKYDSLFKSIEGAAPQMTTEYVFPNNWLYTIKVPQQNELRKHLLK